MRPDSPAICAERRAVLDREVRAYLRLPEERRRAAERSGQPPTPPDAVIELRIVNGRLVVRSEQVDVVVRGRDQLVAVVLEAVRSSRPPVKTRS